MQVTRCQASNVTACVSKQQPRKGIFKSAGLGLCTFGASVSLLFPSPVLADVTIKMGGDDGSLEFVPSRVTVRTGEKVTFENNSSFPHSIKFDEVPEDVDADALYHGLMNSSSDKAEYTFDKPGVYTFACEPHGMAGMKGVIEVVPQ